MLKINGIYLSLTNLCSMKHCPVSDKQLDSRGLCVTYYCVLWCQAKNSTHCRKLIHIYEHIDFYSKYMTKFIYALKKFLLEYSRFAKLC